MLRGLCVGGAMAVLACRPTKTPPLVAPVATTTVSTPPKAPTASRTGDEAAAACRAQVASSRAVVESGLAEFADYGEVDALVRAYAESLLHCSVGGGGAWILVPADWGVSDRLDEDGAIEGVVWVVHVATDGSRAQSEDPVPIELVTTPDAGNSFTSSVLHHADLDGDGVEELLVEHHESGYDVDEFRYEMYTRKGATIGLYAPAEAIEVESVDDYDGDGLPDLVSIEEFWAVNECFGMAGGARYGAPQVLFHARPDGTFSASDAVAREFLEEQCPEMPDELLVYGADEWERDALQQVACARLWGESAAEVAVRIRAEWAALPASAHGEWSCGYDAQTFIDFAEIDPPTVLSR